VSKDASGGEIKKAYHKLSRTHHPDKGGDEEKFKLIQEAFECLKDPDKRKLYDAGGKEAVESGGAAECRQRVWRSIRQYVRTAAQAAAGRAQG
jgi:DnaJ-class molecular chaperone